MLQYNIPIDNLFPRSITIIPDKEQCHFTLPMKNKDRKNRIRKKNTISYYKWFSDPHFLESKVRSLSFVKNRKNKKIIEQRGKISNGEGEENVYEKMQEQGHNINNDVIRDKKNDKRKKTSHDKKEKTSHDKREKTSHDKREKTSHDKRYDKLRDKQKHDSNMKNVKQKQFINEKRHGTKRLTSTLISTKNNIKSNNSVNKGSKHFRSSRNRSNKNNEVNNNNTSLKLHTTNNNNNIYKSKDKKMNDISLDITYKRQLNDKPSLCKNRKNNNTNTYKNYSTNINFYSQKNDYYLKKTQLKNSICISNSQIYSDSISDHENTISSLNELLFSDTVIFCNLSCLFYVLTSKFKIFLQYIERINQVVQSAHMKK
ncbi:conserved protein, unknown function [Hepatocystis sp. ex Piliocolobus tephrosceles]|nr:conserved protein, unknown function [Hepatocystis sp. ex Piliocolobus tephrosceles]